jgi:hypothetical protein
MTVIVKFTTGRCPSPPCAGRHRVGDLMLRAFFTSPEQLLHRKRLSARRSPHHPRHRGAVERGWPGRVGGAGPVPARLAVG